MIDLHGTWVELARGRATGRNDMTDRLGHLLPPRLVVPLVLLLLGAVLWIPVRNNRHAPPLDAAPLETVPIETTRSDQAPPPRIFLAGERIESIPTPANQSARVWEAGFTQTRQSPGYEALASSSMPARLPPATPPAGPMLAPAGPMLAPEPPKRLPLVAPCPVPPKSGFATGADPADIEGAGSSDVLKAPLPVGPSLVAGPSDGSSGSGKPGGSVDVSLPAPSAPVGRSEQLERIAQQADIHTRRGFGLASRGAHFSARTEFVRALRLVAQGLDTEYDTDEHSRALAAGLTALKEAEDFVPRGSRLEADLDVPGIIGGHRTPVLKEENLDKTTALEALQTYFTFGQSQLGKAVRPEVAGSMALHALGKLHACLAGEKRVVIRAAEPKAIVFYQAALLSDPLNYMAANDLGAFLARSGRYEDAERLLRYGLAGGQPVSWRNLAVVYQQLGWADRAAHAESRWQLAGGGPAKPPAAAPTVRWMEPTEFARSSPRPPNAWHSSKPSTPAAPSKADPPTVLTVPGTPPEKTAWWWPWGNAFK